MWRVFRQLLHRSIVASFLGRPAPRPNAKAPRGEGSKVTERALRIFEAIRSYGDPRVALLRMTDSRVHRRSARSDAEQSASPAWKGKTGFQLPPDVSFEKQRLSDAWVYVFRHRVLGELGRILLQELDDGRC